MVGQNLFKTFEEEHLETLYLPRYNTRVRAKQHSTHSIQHHVPRVFCPIMVTNANGCHLAPHQDINPIPMANDVINQCTGSSLECRQLIQDETMFPIWNKSAVNECGSLAQGVGGRTEGSNTILFTPLQAMPKRKVVTYI
jgi:hypothetical protein